MKHPVLTRHAVGCPVCGSDKARMTASRRWSKHKPADGYSDGVRYGTVGATPDCPASGKSRGEIDELFRTFECWGNDRARGYGRYATLRDNGDSVIVGAEVGFGGENSIELDAIIRPEDTRRLLAELTAIAVKNGLVPDPAAAVRAAVAAELRTLADEFAAEALRRHETGDDDMAEDDCADRGTSCHTNEAVFRLTAVKNKLRRRADLLDPPGVD